MRFIVFFSPPSLKPRNQEKKKKKRKKFKPFVIGFNERLLEFQKKI